MMTKIWFFEMRNLLFNFVFLMTLICSQSACGLSNVPNSENRSEPKFNYGSKIEESKEYSNLKKQVLEFCDSQVNNDYEKTLDFSYPKLIANKMAVLKTRENVIEFLRKHAEQYEADGFKLLKITVAEVGKVERIDYELFSLVTVIVENNSPNGKMVGEMPLIAISNNDGISWYFVDNFTQESFKRFFPKASEKIQIPNPKRIG